MAYKEDNVYFVYICYVFLIYPQQKQLAKWRLKILSLMDMPIYLGRIIVILFIQCSFQTMYMYVYAYKLSASIQNPFLHTHIHFLICALADVQIPLQSNILPPRGTVIGDV